MSRMRSTLSANHWMTPSKSYPRLVCLLPLKTPGVSISVMPCARVVTTGCTYTAKRTSRQREKKNEIRDTKKTRRKDRKTTERTGEDGQQTDRQTQTERAPKTTGRDKGGQERRKPSRRQASCLIKKATHATASLRLRRANA